MNDDVHEQPQVPLSTALIDHLSLIESPRAHIIRSTIRSHEIPGTLSPKSEYRKAFWPLNMASNDPSRRGKLENSLELL